MAKTSRDVVFEVLIPRLKVTHPDGIVSRAELLAEHTRADIPFQPWLTVVAPKRGFYDLSAFYAGGENVLNGDSVEREDERSDAEIVEEIDARFAAVERMSHGIVDGSFRAMVLSGNPGIGKSHTLEQILEAGQTEGTIEYQKVTGYMRATGVYKLLWENREKNDVLLFDDADAAFADENALNLLKAACDSTRKRVIAWRVERTMEDEIGEDIPREFEFHGRVIFVTNLDFDRLVAQQTKNSVHYEALMSRSFYLDLNLEAGRALMLRVLSVADNSTMLDGMEIGGRDSVLSYVREHASKLREVSLRTIIKLRQCFEASQDYHEFAKLVAASCHKKGV